MSLDRIAVSLAVFLAVPLAACGDDEEVGTIEPTYENVQDTIDTSCTFSSCHGGGGVGGGMLNLAMAIDAGDLRTVLVDVPACQYDPMPRVDPGNPENSWLMVKLTGAHDADGRIQFTPDPAWAAAVDTSAPSTCPLVEDGELSFGELMPQSLDEPQPLPEARIEMFRQWIEDGAPGPGE